MSGVSRVGGAAAVTPLAALVAALLAATPAQAATVASLAVDKAIFGLADPVTGQVTFDAVDAGPVTVRLSGDLLDDPIDCPVAEDLSWNCGPVGKVGRFDVIASSGDVTVSGEIVVTDHSYAADPAVMAHDVLAGDPISVTVSGWTHPDRAVRWLLRDSNGQELGAGEIAVDETGNGTVLVPTPAFGDRVVTVEVTDGLLVRTAEATVVAWSLIDAGVVLTPSSPTVGSSVNLSGAGFNLLGLVRPLVRVMDAGGVEVLSVRPEVGLDSRWTLDLSSLTESAGTHTVEVSIPGLLGRVIFSQALTVSLPPAPRPPRPAPTTPAVDTSTIVPAGPVFLALPDLSVGETTRSLRLERGGDLDVELDDLDVLPSSPPTPVGSAAPREQVETVHAAEQSESDDSGLPVLLLAALAAAGAGTAGAVIVAARKRASTGGETV